MGAERSVPPDDFEVVAGLLGRRPEGGFAVVLRSADGTPQVIENAPLLEDGRPMPTRFWLVGPELRAQVSRLESAGGVRQAEAAVDPFAVEEAHAAYARERDRALVGGQPGPRPTGGVGGTRRGVKCLHAHLAWWLVGGADPVGAWTAEQIGLSGRPAPGEPLGIPPSFHPC